MKCPTCGTEGINPGLIQAREATRLLTHQAYKQLFQYFEYWIEAKCTIGWCWRKRYFELSEGDFIGLLTQKQAAIAYIEGQRA